MGEAVHMWSREYKSIREISVFVAQYCCESKPALKKIDFINFLQLSLFLQKLRQSQCHQTHSHVSV